jgi:GT2 family glycosyltransferase
LPKAAGVTKYPLVYVLILNWNGREVTPDCVASLLKSEYPNFRIVVIDNNSSDGSVQALDATYGGRITILQNSANLGYSRGFNVGLRFGFERNGADYCLVMNNDTVIDSRAITELVRVAESDDRFGFVTGKVYYYDKPDVLQTVGKAEDPIRWNGDHIGGGEVDRGQYDQVSERPFADDIFTLVSRKLYTDTNGYNPIFFLQGEEYDWQARAKKLGYKIVFTPYARLWHRESWVLGKQSTKKAYYDARNPMLVVLLHKSPEFFRRYFWHSFRKDILKGSLISFRQARVPHALARWRGFLSGMIWGLKNRRLTLRHLI